MRRTANGHEVSFRGDGNIPKLDNGDGCKLLTFSKITELLMLKKSIETEC